MNRPSPLTLIFLAIPGLAFVLFLLPLPLALSEGWRGELLNRLHAPLMALCYLALAALLHRSRHSSPLLLAAAGTALMAALVELIQPWFGRTASMQDFGWGMAGLLGGCLWCGARHLQTTPLRRSTQLLAIACVLTPPLAWLYEVALTRAEAQRLFPVLVTGEHPRLQPLWSIVPTPATDTPTCLTRKASHPASLHLDTLDRDWSDFSTLEIAGTLEAPAAVEIGVRLDLDSDGKTRLRASGIMQPGTGVLQIPWPTTVPPRCVHQLVVFLTANPLAARLHIQHLRLMPGTKKIRSAGLQDAGIAQ